MYTNTQRGLSVNKLIHLSLTWYMMYVYDSYIFHLIRAMCSWNGTPEPHNLTAVRNTSNVTHWTGTASLHIELYLQGSLWKILPCHTPCSHKWHLGVFFFLFFSQLNCSSSKRSTFSKSNLCHLCNLRPFWPLFVKGQVSTEPCSRLIVFKGQNLILTKMSFFLCMYAHSKVWLKLLNKLPLIVKYMSHTSYS